MKKVNMLKKLGEKMAIRSTDATCEPKYWYQPKPPAKLREMMEKNK